MSPKDSSRTNGTLTSSMATEDRAFLPSEFSLEVPKARRLIKAAKRHLPKTLPPMIETSCTSSGTAPSCLKDDDLQAGPMIGFGGFGLVQAVVAIRCDAFSSQPKNRMVRKTLIPHTTAVQLLNGCLHLETEKRTLLKLEHPNIVRLRGYSQNGLDRIKDTQRLDSYYLVLDYLPETLTERIQAWKGQRTQHSNSNLNHQKNKFRVMWKPGPKVSKQLLREQLEIAVDIASALQYLHEKRIILRDLKPDNVGFDEDGQVKLFDFGLVAHLPPDCDLEATHDDLSGYVGTPRYMASEVIRNQPYNCKADVFSFSLVLWEMLTQQRALDRQTSSVYGERPSIPKFWPPALQRIVQRGWSDDLSERPCMTEYSYVLQDLIRQHCSK